MAFTIENFPIAVSAAETSERDRTAQPLVHRLASPLSSSSAKGAATWRSLSLSLPPSGKEPDYEVVDIHAEQRTGIRYQNGSGLLMFRFSEQRARLELNSRKTPSMKSTGYGLVFRERNNRGDALSRWRNAVRMVGPTKRG